MKKKIKDLTKKQIFNEIYCNGKTSIGDDNCRFCRYCGAQNCKILCNIEYETCIDYEAIIKEVGEQEIEVEDDD